MSDPVVETPVSTSEPAAPPDAKADPPTPSPTPAVIAPVRSRYTVSETVYHQQTGQQPRAFQSRYNHPLSSDEQPVERTIVIGPDWVEFPKLWVDVAAQILVFNHEGSGLQVRPSLDEEQEISRHVIEIGILVGSPELTRSPRTQWDPPRKAREELAIVSFSQVRPGQSCRFEPIDLAYHRVRCLHGQARCTFVAIPA